MFFLLYPLCLLRALWRPVTVAPDPTCFLMAAPVPFVTMALFAAREGVRSRTPTYPLT